MVIYGLYLWIDIQGDQSSLRGKLRATIAALPPYQFDHLEKEYRCCGFDKFTDYYDPNLYNISSNCDYNPPSLSPKVTSSNYITADSTIVPETSLGNQKKIRVQHKTKFPSVKEKQHFKKWLTTEEITTKARYRIKKLKFRALIDNEGLNESENKEEINDSILEKAKREIFQNLSEWRDETSTQRPNFIRCKCTFFDQEPNS